VLDKTQDTASLQASALTPPATRPNPKVRGHWRGKLQVLGCQIGLAAVLLGLWQYATSSQALNAFLFGSPSQIAEFLVKMAQDGSLVHDAEVTGLETLLGFLLGNIIGTVLGLLLWYSRFVSKVVQPFIVALGSIPVVALAPLVIIWFGTGLASKLAMSTLSVVVVALVIAYKGATGIDDDQINLMRTLGAKKRQIFRKLVIPASLRDIFSGLKLTVGFALIGAILGEFMSSSDGLGHAIFKAGSLYIIPKVFAGVVVVIALALFLSFLVGRLERILMPWHRFD
jgi:NitT/TauT family transport system permease protein